MHTIYLITNHNTGKHYVGQTCRPLNERWAEHQRSSRGWVIAKSIKKHGAGAFTIDTLATAMSQEDANWYEKHFIQQYDTLNKLKGYNIAEGGHNGNPYAGYTTEEKAKVARKISVGNTGKVRSEDFKKRLSVLMSGENHPLYGVPVSEETKLKISIGNKGQRRSKAFAAKRAAYMTGKKLSASTKAKISMKALLRKRAPDGTFLKGG